MLFLHLFLAFILIGLNMLLVGQAGPEIDWLRVLSVGLNSVLLSWGGGFIAKRAFGLGKEEP